MGDRDGFDLRDQSGWLISSKFLNKEYKKQAASSEKLRLFNA